MDEPQEGGPKGNKTKTNENDGSGARNDRFISKYSNDDSENKK
jgi:hypothetical protein